MWFVIITSSISQQEIVDIIKAHKDDGPLLLHHVDAIDKVISKNEEVHYVNFINCY